MRKMIKLFSPRVSPEARSAVEKVLLSGWIGLGPKTEEFERDFAKYVGAKYAVATSSATAALQICSFMQTKTGDVLTTPMTFVSTNHVIKHNGDHPIFVDVDPYTLNIDLNKAEDAITKHTKAILAMHYSGNPINIDDLYSLANRYGLEVIEDAAHACGASYRDKKVGSFGLTCFSFHAVKNLPTGDGGMITTNLSHVAEQARRLRWLGIDKSTYERSNEGYSWEYDVINLGFKAHMNDITAAMGVEHLKDLDNWNFRRRELVDRYKENLPIELFLKETEGARSSNHLCVLRIPNRDEVYKKLHEQGVQAGVHYKPNHLHRMYRSYGYSLPEAEKAYEEIISLPLHLDLSFDDVDFISRIVKNNI
jgi:perosamine synthetase